LRARLADCNEEAAIAQISCGALRVLCLLSIPLAGAILWATCTAAETDAQAGSVLRVMPIRSAYNASAMPGLRQCPKSIEH
jgi:hypothetical protein